MAFDGAPVIQAWILSTVNPLSPEVLVTLFLALSGITAVASVAAAAGAWRRPRPDPRLVGRLHEMERRLEDELERLRAAVDQAVRESGRAFSAAQTDTAVALSARIEESQKALIRLFAEHFHRSQDAQHEGFHRLTGAVTQHLGAARDSQDARLLAVESALREITVGLQSAMGGLRAEVSEASMEQGERVADATGALADALGRRLEELRLSLTSAMEALRDNVQERLDEVRRDNDEKLERMRQTVDEKLHATLEQRLGESFRTVSERLEQVHRGLGEMKTLAEGVGDLKRVLTNVKARGTFGEVQLESLLEQVFNPRQYRKNVITNPDSAERVEFAVCLPGRDGNDTEVLLPIDAKFPQEDYLRLASAYESNDTESADTARRALRTRLLEEAETVCRKYVAPPHTTDFALLFVPTEGLYAEALRMDGLVEEMQRRWRVVLVGPTTLYAILNSLQMGFRTLAIEKRSSEVWKILGAVKTEFARFGESLDAVGRKLQEASSKLDESARRSRAVERRLREVEQIPHMEARQLLPELDDPFRGNGFGGE